MDAVAGAGRIKMESDVGAVEEERRGKEPLEEGISRC